VLGIKVAASTVWEILHTAGIDPRTATHPTTWAAFLRSRAEAIIAADFFETVTLTGTRLYVLAAIERATRRVRILGATSHPTTAWVTQAARNLAMDLHDAGCQIRYVIRDHDGKYPAPFDAVLADTGIATVLTGERHYNSHRPHRGITNATEPTPPADHRPECHHAPTHPTT
jgi:hypothetical protein